MSVKEVTIEVERIRAMAGDDESAHSAEDRLHVRVLMAIAAGADNAQDLAIEALKTHDIEFARWCA